jgi:DNA-binding CsgD family transcriptional regulator
MQDLEARHDQTVALIYGAVLDPLGWDKAMAAITAHVDADVWNLQFWDTRTNNFRFMFTSDLVRLQKDVALYAAHYGAIDPRKALASRLAPGEWLACNQHFDARFVDRSAFYQDFLIPCGLRYALGGTVFREDGTEVIVAIMRSPERPEFSMEEFRRAQRFIPHLTQAVGLFLQTEQLRARAIMGELGLEFADFAIAAIDEDARLAYANKKAEAIFRSGVELRSHAGFLRLAGEDESRFQRMVEKASRERVAGSLRVGRGGEELLVNVLPLPESLSLPHLLFRCTVLILVSQPGRRRVPTARQLMQLFDLSPAEARLTRALAQGQTPEEYAIDNGLSLNTVKTQLRYVREKTGFKRVTDIVRVLAGVPAVRD